MRRIAPIIISILIGALAVSGGMGFYLSKANADRERLATLADEAVKKADIAQQESQRAILAANQNLDEARQRMQEAKATIAILQQERDMAAKAKILDTPTPASIKGWKEAANVSLGISLKYPPSSVLLSNDGSSLTLAAATNTDEQDYRWLDAREYDQRLETELLGSLTTTTDILLLQQGRLLVGKTGGDINGREVYVLHLVKNGTPEKLIWARNPIRSKTDHSLLSSLATLQFAE